METKVVEERFRIKVERIVTRQRDTTTPHLVREAPMSEEEYQKRPYLQQHYADRPIPMEKIFESKPDIELKTDTTEILDMVTDRINLKALIEAAHS